jgi:cob(I)alamin adenosyltransferase
MKIYTKTGDDGTTGLIGGKRVRKDDLRLDAYGTVDELCAAIGWAAVEAEASMLARLRAVQVELFVIGSHLATPIDEPNRNTSWLPDLKPESIARLECEIDDAEASLPPLKNFILPGGSETSARLHVARTVCRRAERLLVGLTAQQTVHASIVTYLNRLSDWLFVQARLANSQQNVTDIPWVP